MSQLLSDLVIFTALTTITSCSVKKINEQKLIEVNDTLHVKAKLIYADNFDNGLENWSIEQNKTSKTSIINQQMDIEGTAGYTVWFKQKTDAPIMILYDAIIVDKGGVNDRVSDLNCFWLATDPKNPDNLFANTERKGIFANYDNLQLYYVGLGGHVNTKTRFRKYEGTGDKPILPENDLSDAKFLITPNQVNHIKIIAIGNLVQYYRNNLLIYNIKDENSYKTGYFGIRGTQNHMVIDNFRVFSLKNNR